jgi:hypothetical protein
MIGANVQAKMLQTLMGHKDIRITMDTYSHLYEGADSAAMEQFEKFLTAQAAPSVPHTGAGNRDSKGGCLALLSHGAYRDRTDDLQLAKQGQTWPPVISCRAKPLC